MAVVVVVVVVVAKKVQQTLKFDAEEFVMTEKVFAFRRKIFC